MTFLIYLNVLPISFCIRKRSTFQRFTCFFNINFPSSMIFS